MHIPFKSNPSLFCRDRGGVAALPLGDEASRQPPGTMQRPLVQALPVLEMVASACEVLLEKVTEGR